MDLLKHVQLMAQSDVKYGFAAANAMVKSRHLRNVLILKDGQVEDRVEGADRVQEIQKNNLKNQVKQNAFTT